MMNNKDDSEIINLLRELIIRELKTKKLKDGPYAVKRDFSGKYQLKYIKKELFKKDICIN